MTFSIFGPCSQSRYVERVYEPCHGKGFVSRPFTLNCLRHQHDLVFRALRKSQILDAFRFGGGYLNALSLEGSGMKQSDQIHSDAQSLVSLARSSHLPKRAALAQCCSDGVAFIAPGRKPTEDGMRLRVAATSALACSLLIDPAVAAQSCVTRSDAMALKTAAVQQQLMVAAFMCHDARAYNGFVRAYQADLQDSDASLKSYFVHRLGHRGEAAYDTYKTKVANLSALSQARNDRAFCSAADRLFAQAQESRVSLDSFVEDAPSPPGFRKPCISAPAEVGSRMRLHMAQAKPPGSR